MVQQKAGLGLIASAIGEKCTYCGVVMAESGDTRPSRDHIIPRSHAARLSDYDGQNRVIVCSACNNWKADDTLRDWLDVVITAGDANRASRVSAFIATLYLDSRETADRLSGKTPAVAIRRRERRALCSFPNCSCRGFCGVVSFVAPPKLTSS